jgi:hypothetical protein
MWLEAIKAGNCDTFDGLTYSNAARYSPNSNNMIMGHLAQQHQNVRSTKPKAPKATPSPELPPMPLSTVEEPSNQVFVKVYPLSKLYTSDTGRFPVQGMLGKPICHGCLPHQQQSHSPAGFQVQEQPPMYCCLQFHYVMPGGQGLSVDLQILNNETSMAYNKAITF